MIGTGERGKRKMLMKKSIYEENALHGKNVRISVKRGIDV